MALKSIRVRRTSTLPALGTPQDNDALLLMRGGNAGRVPWQEVRNAALSGLRERGVSVVDYGAVGDGLADDTAAIQAAANSGLNVYFPARLYQVSATITLSVRGQRLFADGDLAAGSEAQVSAPALGRASAVLSRAVNDGSPMFLVRESQVAFSGIGFYGTNRGTHDQIAIKFEKLVNTDDMDGYVARCAFVNFRTGIQHVGRAIYAHDNLFVSGTTGIALSWPAAGVEATSPQQDLPLGHRAARIHYNRFHSMLTAVSSAGEVLRGAYIACNTLDTGERLLDVTGGLHKCIIAENLCDQCNSTVINIAGPITDTSVLDNQIGGTAGDLDNSPSWGVRFNGAGTIKNVAIVGNSFSDIKGPAIIAEGDATVVDGLAVIGNTFQRLNMNASATGSVLALGFSVSGLIFVGNTCREAAPPFVIRFTSGTLTLADSTITGNVWDRTKDFFSSFVNGGGNIVAVGTMRVNQDHSISTDGKLGIQKTTPFRALHIVDTIAAVARLEREGSSGGVNFEFTNSLGTLTFGATPTGTNTGAVNPGADNGISLGGAGLRYTNVFAVNTRTGAGTTLETSGAGSPEGVVTAAVGSLYRRIDGAAGQRLYWKATGAGNTGWVAML